MLHAASWSHLDAVTFTRMLTGRRARANSLKSGCRLVAGHQLRNRSRGLISPCPSWFESRSNAPGPPMSLPVPGITSPEKQKRHLLPGAVNSNSENYLFFGCGFTAGRALTSSFGRCIVDAFFFSGSILPVIFSDSF